MPVYLGNQLMTEYVGGISTDVIGMRTPKFILQSWNVQPCAGGTITQLSIDVGIILTAGQAVRPTIEPNNDTRLPGYETGCWVLLTPASDGIYCGTKAPAADCSYAVCL